MVSPATIVYVPQEVCLLQILVSVLVGDAFPLALLGAVVDGILVFVAKTCVVVGGGDNSTASAGGVVSVHALISKEMNRHKLMIKRIDGSP